MKELTVQEAALAWAQGKKVEAMGPATLTWEPLIEVGGGFGHWLPGILTHKDNLFRFRLAAEPPAKKYRPWTPEEVPVGAQVRYAKNQRSIRMLITSNVEPHLLGYGCKWNLEDLCKSMEHSIDNGKTWLPCGVEVEA